MQAQGAIEMATNHNLRHSFERAQATGYQIHLGIEGDGELRGRYWWTLCRPGWSGIESSEGDWASEDEVMTDVCRAYEAEVEHA